MQPSRDPALARLQWLTQYGVLNDDLDDLNPCVPGEFTTAGALYVNTGSPNVIYHGTEEGTLPLVAGRWYLLPARLPQRFPRLAAETRPVSAAPRLVG